MKTQEILHASTRKFAVIGSGPAGFYMTRKLLSLFRDSNQEHISVDIYDKAPLPYGLVRSGIAPDHQGMKNCLNQFKDTLNDKRVNLFTNVEIVNDINEKTDCNLTAKLPISDLLTNYSSIVLCCGAEGEIKLDIPVEDQNKNKLNVSSRSLSSFNNFFSSREFVAWYNGEFEESTSSRVNNLDFSKIKSVVIIGNGNVALDIARILSKDFTNSPFDFPDHVLNKFKNKNIEKISLIARRGAVQSAFSSSEISELSKLCEINTISEEIALSQNSVSLEELKIKSNSNKFKKINSYIKRESDEIDANVENNSISKTRIFLRYLLSPFKLIADKLSDNNYSVKQIVLKRTILEGSNGKQKAVIENTSESIHLNCDLVISSIGYKPIFKFKDYFPIDSKTNLIIHNQGNVKKLEDDNYYNNVYASGWYKRGATGILGMTIIDANECYAKIVNNSMDEEKIKPINKLASNNNNIIDAINNDSYIYNYEKLFSKISNDNLSRVIFKEDCLKLLELEEDKGKNKGKLLDKFLSRSEIFDELKRIKNKSI